MNGTLLQAQYPTGFVQAELVEEEDEEVSEELEEDEAEETEEDEEA